MPNSFTKPVSANDILSALGRIAVDMGTSSGSANALAGASTVDTGTTFTSGRLYRIRANAANTGAATCSINGGTGVALKKPPSSTALASGDIANATELLLFFDGTNLQVLSGLTVSATDSTKVPLSTVTTKGDLITATGSGAVTRRAVGSANQFLAPNSGNSDGLEWRALTPSDLPAIRFDAPLVDGQSLSFGDYNYLETGTPTTNNLFTVSGTGNITFTSLYAGVLEIYVSIAADKFEGMLRVEKNGSFVREGFVNAFVNRVTIATAVPIAIGDVIKMNAYSSGSATLVVGSGAGTLFMALRS